MPKDGKRDRVTWQLRRVYLRYRSLSRRVPLQPGRVQCYGRQAWPGEHAVRAYRHLLLRDRSAAGMTRKIACITLDVEADFHALDGRIRLFDDASLLDRYAVTLSNAAA